jgi:hypothetical protein
LFGTGSFSPWLSLFGAIYLCVWINPHLYVGIVLSYVEEERLDFGNSLS